LTDREYWCPHTYGLWYVRHCSRSSLRDRQRHLFTHVSNILRAKRKSLQRHVARLFTPAKGIVIYLVTAVKRDLLGVRDHPGMDVAKVRLPVGLHGDQGTEFRRQHPQYLPGDADDDDGQQGTWKRERKRSISHTFIAVRVKNKTK